MKYNHNCTEIYAKYENSTTRFLKNYSIRNYQPWIYLCKRVQWFSSRTNHTGQRAVLLWSALFAHNMMFLCSPPFRGIFYIILKVSSHLLIINEVSYLQKKIILSFKNAYRYGCSTCTSQFVFLRRNEQVYFYYSHNMLFYLGP